MSLSIALSFCTKANPPVAPNLFSFLWVLLMPSIVAGNSYITLRGIIKTPYLKPEAYIALYISCINVCESPNTGFFTMLSLNIVDALAHILVPANIACAAPLIALAYIT